MLHSAESAANLDMCYMTGLTRLASPWVLGKVDWDQKLTKQAVIWLAKVVGKPILKLTDPDYDGNALQVLEMSEIMKPAVAERSLNEPLKLLMAINGVIGCMTYCSFTAENNFLMAIQDLLAEQGPAYDINLRVFHELQSTITGWPGGKPSAPAPTTEASRHGSKARCCDPSNPPKLARHNPVTRVLMPSECYTGLN